MFSPAQEQQIYRTSRYLLGLLQPRLDRACRLQVRTWLAEALEQMSSTERQERFRKLLACAMPWIDAHMGDFAVKGDQFKCFVGVGDSPVPGLHHPDFLPPDDVVRKLRPAD